MADQFAGWAKLLELAQANKTKAALREAITKAGIQIIETEPLSGYYRSAAVKDGPLLPVAIWREGETLHVYRAGEPVKLERVWPYCVWHPISYDWYELVADKGGNWPDAAAPVEKEPEPRPTETAESQQPSAPAASSTHTPTASSTEPAKEEESEEDKLTRKKEADALKARIEAAKAAAQKSHLDIKSDDDAAAAQSARAALNKLSGDADKKRKALMEPFESKAKAIHETWMPLVKDSKEGAKEILDAINKWLNVTKPAQQRAAATALAEAQAEAAKNAPLPVETSEGAVPTADGVVERSHNMQPAADQPPSADVVPLAAPATTSIKGATGRAAPINEVKTATVTDYDALYAHVKAFPEVKTVLDRIAQRLVGAGQTPPGVKIDTMLKAS